MLRYRASLGILMYTIGLLASVVPTTARAETDIATKPAINNTTFSGPTLCDEFVGPDFNHDCYVDLADYKLFQLCVTGPNLGPPSVGCEDKDLDGDNDVDESDFTYLPQCTSGPEYITDVGCEDPAYTPPTSLGRIDDELAAGLITETEALSYKVFEVFNDARLPSRFYGATYEEGTHVVQSLSEQYGSLTPDHQVELLPFLLPPDAPGSWYQLRLQQSTAATQAGEPQGDFAKVDVKDGSGTSVAVIKWPVAQSYLSEATAVHNALAGADGVWEKLTTLMGRDPISDAGLDSIYNGADGRYDIYLMPLGGRNYGETTAHSPGFFEGVFDDSRRSSFIVMDITTITRDFPGAQLPKKLSANIAHEFMHVLQFAFDSTDSFSNKIWLWDATATWAEHFVFPDDQLEQDDAPFYLKTLDDPLEVNQGKRRYGAYLFFFHHAIKYGDNIIRTIFENTESMNSLAAVNIAVPGGFTDNWAEFTVKNWNDTNNPPIDGYEAEDSLKVGAAKYANFELPILGVSQDKIELEFSGDGLEPLSAQYFWIKLGDQQIRSIMFANGLTFDLEEGVPSVFDGAIGDEFLHATYLSDAETKQLHVMALIKQNGNWLPDPIDLARTAFAPFCQEASSESIEEIVFIMANARFEGSERTPVTVKGLSSRLFMSNMGCGAWEGTARNVYSVTTPDEVTTSTTNFTQIKFVRDTITLQQIAAGDGQQQFGPATAGTLVIPASVFGGLNPLAGAYRLDKAVANWTHSSSYSSGDNECSESGSGAIQFDDALQGAVFTTSPYLTASQGNELPSIYRSFFISAAFVDGNENIEGVCIDSQNNSTFYDSVFGAALGGGFRNMEFGTLTIDNSGNRINESWTLEENSFQLNLQSKKIP